MADLVLHPFEAAGLGLAPFRLIGVEDRGRVSCGCDYCGTGIRIVCTLKSKDGRVFKVGTDCVEKRCLSVDTSLALEVRKARARVDADKREAKRIAAWERLKARVERARATLAEDAELFATEPHPHPYHAGKGRTRRDYVEWMLTWGGQSGKTDVCRLVETAATNRTPT